jgi:hypothetical protein
VAEWCRRASGRQRDRGSQGEFCKQPFFSFGPFCPVNFRSFDDNQTNRCLLRRGRKSDFADALQLPERSESKRADLPFTGPVQGPLAYSPPSYPSPWGSGAGEWADAYAKARQIVSQMTLLEKVNLTTGVG